MKMEDVAIHAELLPVIEAVTIQGPEQFRFAGVKYAATAVRLEDLLYQHCYARRFSGSVVPAPVSAPPPDPDWVQRLSFSNCSQGGYAEGWTVAQVFPNGYVFAQRGTVCRGFWAGEFLRKNAMPGPLQPGAKISVRIGAESHTAQPGFYFAFGETLGDAFDDAALLRLYWNVRPQGAPVLIEHLSRQLNRYKLPFHFKVPNHPKLYGRTDAGTLYVPRRSWRVVARAVQEVYRAVHEYLDRQTPLFSKQLAPGLGLAEDPGTAESFGTSRCHLLAGGLRLAYQGRAETTLERLQCVSSTFARAGVSLQQPWLKAGSKESYELGWEA